MFVCFEEDPITFYFVLTGTLFIFHSNVADGSDPFDVQFACNSSPDWYCSLVPVITGSCVGKTVRKYIKEEKIVLHFYKTRF